MKKWAAIDSWLESLTFIKKIIFPTFLFLKLLLKKVIYFKTYFSLDLQHFCTNNSKFAFSYHWTCYIINLLNTRFFCKTEILRDFPYTLKAGISKKKKFSPFIKMRILFFSLHSSGRRQGKINLKAFQK
jgi:hypothetical protein